MPVAYLKLFTKAVLVELISILFAILPVQPLGNVTVPVPTNTIFVVPDTLPLVSVVELIELVLIVLPLMVGPVPLPPRRSVPVLIKKLPAIVKVAAGIVKVPVKFKLDPSVRVSVVLIITLFQDMPDVFNVAELINVSVIPVVSTEPAI